MIRAKEAALKMAAKAGSSEAPEKEAGSLLQALTAAEAPAGLLGLLAEFDTVLNARSDEPLTSEAEFWSLSELSIVTRCMHVRARGFLSQALVGASSDRSVHRPSGGGPLDTKALADQAKKLNELQQICAAHIQQRVAATKVAPAARRLGALYTFSSAEQRLFEYLVAVASTTSSVLTMQLAAFESESEVNESRNDTIVMQCLLKLTALELEDFVEDSREHIKDGTIVVDFHRQDSGMSLPRVSHEAQRALRGLPLTMERRLKLTETRIVELLNDSAADDDGDDKAEPEAAEFGTQRSGGVHPLRRDKERSGSETTAASSISNLDMETLIADMELKEASDRQKKKKRGGRGGATGVFLVDGEKKGDADADEDGKSGASESSDLPPSMLASMVRVEGDDGEDTAFGPYTSSLQYLDDHFALLLLYLRAAELRRKDKLKQAGAHQSRDYYDNKREANKFELMAKQRMTVSRIEHRLRLTRDAGFEVPRLEKLAQKLRLDGFEKKVIVLLIGFTLSPVVKAIYSQTSGGGGGAYDEDNVGPLAVKSVLETFCDSFADQVSKRVYFYKSKRMMKSGLIKLRRASSWNSSNDLVDQVLELDRRILDWVVGLDTEINEVVEGSNLYTPSAQLDQVVLPEELKSRVLSTVDNYERFRNWRKRVELDAHIHNIGGLVLMFCGPSGTGKTLLANALAARMKKKLLLVNFDLLQSGASSGRGGDGIDLKGLFREAEMNDAVLFFDECESLFAKRESGGSAMMTRMLTTLERYEGIVFLATNRPYDLDEAMHRRITAVYEFAPPDYQQRRRIWEMHTANEHMRLAPGVDLDRLSLRYELSGGFIKNAVVSALLLAVARDKEAPVVLEEDLVKGCVMQMRGSLKMRSFTSRVVPRQGIDSLVLTKKLRKHLERVVAFDKARGVLFGEWGMAEQMRDKQGTTCLFWGPPGTGKSLAAEALGFEVGRPLKVVSFSQLLLELNHGSFGGHGSSSVGADSTSGGGPRHGGIDAIFADARLQDAVLVLENFNPDIAHGGVDEGHAMGSSSSPMAMAFEAIMWNIERFPGTVVIIITARKPLGMCLHRMHPDFLRRLKFVLEFKAPSPACRKKLWKLMLPTKAPIADDVDLEDLGQRFAFAGGAIGSAIFRAAAVAALRTGKKRKIFMADLVAGAKEEQAKTESEVGKMYQQLFT